jgi:uncharacterized protein
MTEMTSYPPGYFCWTELATSDGKAAKKFYTSLFGWTANEMPIGPDQPPYVILQKSAKDVCALYENKKVPSNWLSYVSVASADESAKKVKSLGGKLISEPFEVFELGRMANAQDPQGARFALWQPRSHIGARVINEPNSMCWNELYTTDIEGARKFYSALFNWKLNLSPGYTEAHVGDVAVGGMLQQSEQMKGMTPDWIPYFAVSDCDASAKKAKSLGARVGVEPMDIPKVGRFSVLADPQGARFAMIKMTSSS